MAKFKVWFAKHLRYFADRIDYEHAMVLSMYKFEMLPGVGAVVYNKHEVPSSETGVKLWYLVNEYEEKTTKTFKEKTDD